MPSLQSFFFRLYLNYLKATTDWHAPVEKLRALTEQSARLTRLPKNVDVKRMMAAGVPAEWLHPAHADPRKVILYLHGGGYAVGSCNSHRALAARIARAGNADTLLLDYRLARNIPTPLPSKTRSRLTTGCCAIIIFRRISSWLGTRLAVG